MSRITWQRLRTGRRGVAGLEFALMAPILITMVLGVVDLTNAIVAWRRLSVAAEEIAEIATEMAAQLNGTNTITATQVYQASTAAFGVLPAWRNPQMATRYAITVSSVTYTPAVATCTTAGCAFNPATAWSAPFSLGITEKRACGALTRVPNTQANSLTTMPYGVESSSSLIVVDVLYVFQPMFFTFITGPITMLRSAYLPPRIGANNQPVAYSPTGTSVSCS